MTAAPGRPWMTGVTVLLLLGLAAGAGCMAGQAPPTRVEPASLTFSEPSTPTEHPDGFGSEPSLLAAPDGTLYFTSVLGSATARGDGVWKSRDLGATWQYLGKADYPFGGGDSDLDILGSGRLLLTGQWRPAAPPALPGVGSPYVTGGESVSYSNDGGLSWVPSPAAGYLPAADRNWLATYGNDQAYLVYNNAGVGLVVGSSTDGGITWLPPVLVPGSSRPTAGDVGPNGIAGDAVVDPRDGTLYIPYGPGPGGGTVQRVYSSTDGQSFREHVAHATPSDASSGAIFSSLALDTAGNLYLAFAETHDAGMRIFVTHSTDHAVTWSAAQQVTDARTTAVFPWIVAGGPGRIAIASYAASGSFQSDNADTNTTWQPHVSYSIDALAANATFTTVAAARVNHVGPICTGGTGCASGRTLGDFFETALLPNGRVALVYADDTGDAMENHVVVQTDGPSLLG